MTQWPTATIRNRRKAGRDSRWLILAEFALFALIWFADAYHWHHVIRISKTLYLLALGWISLRLRGMRWKDVGLQLYRTWSRTLAIGVLCGLGMEALELFVTQPLLVRLTHKMAEILSDFAGVTVELEAAAGRAATRLDAGRVW